MFSCRPLNASFPQKGQGNMLEPVERSGGLSPGCLAPGSHQQKQSHVTPAWGGQDMKQGERVEPEGWM